MSFPRKGLGFFLAADYPYRILHPFCVLRWIPMPLVCLSLIKSLKLLSTAFLLVFLAAIACSRLDVREKEPFKDILLQPLADATKQDVKKFRAQLVDVTDKNFTLLPLYSENLDTSDATFDLGAVVQAEFAKAKFRSKDFVSLPLWPEHLRQTFRDYQQYLYEVGVSDRNWSSKIGEYLGTDILLQMQVDSWPNYVEGPRHSNEFEMQLRAIDSDTGLFLWHGILKTTVNHPEDMYKKYQEVVHVLFDVCKQDLF